VADASPIPPRDGAAIDWPAPAKLNLFLHITGQRADGYHLLQTVFQLLDHGDSLRFDVRADGRIRRRSELVGVPEDADLVVRAARALQQLSGTKFGVDIWVDKRLPLGGGLGGGSSNAATTLIALNSLWNCGLSRGRLAEIGVALGADVPVFVHGHSAWGEGVGESLTPVDLPERWYVVLVPPVSVSTAEVFAAPELMRHCEVITIRDFLAGQGDNVCEPVVRARFPEVDAAFKALAPYAHARMTGTGAAVFAAFDDEAQAEAALEAVAGRHHGFIARGCNRSPLLDTLDRVAASGSR